MAGGPQQSERIWDAAPHEAEVLRQQAKHPEPYLASDVFVQVADPQSPLAI